MQCNYISDTQRLIVTDHQRIKLVNGCAGSRKTDTLVKLGVHHMNVYGHSLLFLTLVSSITHEIRTRLKDALGIDIPRVGQSNHFVGEYQGKHVAVANFDAFVHRQLEHCGLDAELLHKNGDCHDWKTQELLKLTAEGRHTDLVMKTGALADIVLVDEFQDMDPCKARILTNILAHNAKLFGIAVGDMMQSIFPRSVDADLAVGHPMNIWKSQLRPCMYYIDTCYRCPAPHVELVQLLLGDHYQRYDVPAMSAARGDTEVHRPVLFCHDKISKNQAAYSIARQVCGALRVLFQHDPTLVPEDVAVIMKKSNNNHVFEQLKVAMQTTFEEVYRGDQGRQQEQDGSGNRSWVVHFETRGDGYHNSIDWGKAEGKAVLLSVHGDKGKGHRVVFFLGLSHRCIPSENNLFKTAELVDVSLVNVALTRSTKYLFVGFTLDAPSRYLMAHEDKLPEYAYTSWTAREWMVPMREGQDTSSGVHYLGHAPPSPYRECITVMNAALLEHRTDALTPNFTREMRTGPLACPSKDIVRIKDDVAKDMGTIFEGLLSQPHFQPQVTVFGGKVRLSATSPATKSSESTTALLGVMGELLVYRYIHQCSPPGCPTFLRRTFGPILSEDRVVYTDDERVLNIVCDHGLNQHARDPDTWSHTLHTILVTHSRFFDVNPDVRAFFGRLSASVRADGPVYVLSHVFSSHAFRRQLRLFMGKEKSATISTRVFWNVALCFNELYESIRRPAVLVHFNCFNDNIRELHANVEAFCDAHIRPATASVTLQAYHRLIVSERDPEVLTHQLGFVNHEDIDADKFTRGYTYGIVGRSDLMIEGTVYEFKTSARVDLSREWVAQALLYCCIPATGQVGRPSRFVIVNLLQGAQYTYTLTGGDMPAAVPAFDGVARQELLERVLKEYGFQDWMVSSITECCPAVG